MDCMLKSSDERVVINDFVQGDPLLEENLDRTLELVSNLRKVDSANPCKMGVPEDKNADRFRLSLPNKSIWIYSGFTWNQLIEEYNQYKYTPFDIDADKWLTRYEIISQCDVMIDGKYIDSQRDITLQWKGSKIRE